MFNSQMDDEDDTMILRMKKDFISFMPTSGTATGSSVKTSQQLVKQLDFNISNLSGDADEGSLRCDNTLLGMHRLYRLCCTFPYNQLYHTCIFCYNYNNSGFLLVMTAI